MLNWLKERQIRSRTARALYGSIVTQARQPGFYAGFSVPDTPRGRFEVLTLHVAAVMRRLQSEGTDGQGLARSLAETFVADMDDSMREMTFSDLAVPREVKKVAAALFDRYAALDAPDNAALTLALQQQLRYLEGEAQSGAIDVDALAHYTRQVAADLASQPLAALREGRVQWPRARALRGDAT